LKDFPWGKQTGTGVAQWIFFQSRGHARHGSSAPIAFETLREVLSSRGARFRRGLATVPAISGAPHPNSRKNFIGLGYFDFQKSIGRN